MGGKDMGQEACWSLVRCWLGVRLFTWFVSWLVCAPVPSLVHVRSADPRGLAPQDGPHPPRSAHLRARGRQRSGVRHRRCDPAWVCDVRDQCIAQGVAYFHKQWGGRTPKAAGRMLDGRTWDELLARGNIQEQILPLR